MKFKLTMTASYLDRRNKDKPLYEALGFKIEPSDYMGWHVESTVKPEIEISHPDEIVKLAANLGPLIITEDGEIEIYNDYRE